MAYRRGRVVAPFFNRARSIVLVLVLVLVVLRPADPPLADPFPLIPVGFLRVILSRSGSHPSSAILQVRPNALRFE